MPAPAPRILNPQPSDVSPETRKKWLPLAILAVALVVWAGMFALGAYLQPGADHPVRDIRKPAIVLASMAAFLAFWGLALWLRSRRK
jgi:hypothetical protein